MGRVFLFLPRTDGALLRSGACQERRGGRSRPGDAATEEQRPRVDRVSTDLDARKASIRSGRAGQEKAPEGRNSCPGCLTASAGVQGVEPPHDEQETLEELR